MTTVALSHPLGARCGEDRGVLVWCAALATFAHVAFGVAVHPERPALRTAAVMEVDLAPPKAPIVPPREPELRPEPAHEAAVSPPSRPQRHAPAASQQRSQAARAGALLTAKEDHAAAPDDSPVDFVTDPQGTSYGAGVVARGGAADFGVRGATASGVGQVPALLPVARDDGITPAANLSRAARLTEADACRGYYPSEASVDEATAVINVVVKANGDVASAAVVSESPQGQGFGRAARTCLATKRFAAAQDRRGQEVTARATIRVRFSR
jgi:TonB family protein